MGAYSKLSYHFVFGTKYRRPTIQPEIRDRLYEYVGGTVRGLNGRMIEIGGIEDHVHLLLNLPPTVSISDAIRDIKTNSSKFLNELPEMKADFEWQVGYGAFTVSYSQIPSVQEYIQKQQEHHRRKSFQEEYAEFLVRHDIAFEPRYLFEGEFHG